MATPRVSLAYVHTNDLAVSFHESLSALVAFDLGGPQFLMHDAGRLAMRCGTDGLVAARNETAAAFLASDSEWLFWLDTDMGFAPETLLNLMAVADQVERPIVGALCFASREVVADGMGGFRTYPRPTIFDWKDLGDGFNRFAGRTIYPPSSMVRCAATGSACILIHRSVFEKVGTSGWYDRLVGTDGTLLGEDISFCARAGAAGFPVFVHTGVRTTHKKSWWIGESDFWQQYMPPPAADEVAVVVPVGEQLGCAESFMRSLRASTGLATAYAIVDISALAAAAEWKLAGAEVIPGDAELVDGAGPVARTRNELVGLGFRQTTEPWVFIAGPDVRFYPGWLDHAQHMAATFGAAVVGTNDLLNPRSLAGEWSDNLLISRDYATSLGDDWPDAGRLAEEAKAAGQWAMALGAIVERVDQDPLMPVGELAALLPSADLSTRTDLAVIVPTRGRPEAIAELVEAMAVTSTAATELVLAIDTDDPRRADYEASVMDAQAAGRRLTLCVVRYEDGRPGNMVAALNAVASWLVRPDNPSPPAAIGFLGDDHRPRTVGWDSSYLAALGDLGTGIVYGDDLLQSERLPTQCAMTADIVQAVGFMAPPSLRHMYVDNFWLGLGHAVGCIRYLPDVVVEHVHPAAGKAEWDEGHKRVNDRRVFSADERAYRAFLADRMPEVVERVQALRGGGAHAWRLFDEGAVPEYTRPEWYAGREHAPHLEQEAHRGRLLRSAALVKYAVKTYGCGSVVDLGAGDGGLLSLLDPGLPAWGYDLQPTNLAAAESRGVDVRYGDVVDGEVEWARLAVATEVIEHLVDPHAFVRRIAEHVDVLVCSSPWTERPGSAYEYHTWAFDLEGYRALVEQAGFKVERQDVVGPFQVLLAVKP